MTPKSHSPGQTPLDAAYRHLAYRPRSEFEIRVWLERKGFGRPAIEGTISTLKKKRLLDDAAFARFWTESRESSSPRSRAALRSELRQKGIDADLVAQAVDRVDDEAAAYRAGHKKAARLSSCDQDVFRRKLSAVLMRRGFTHDVTQHTVDRLWQESGRHA